MGAILSCGREREPSRSNSTKEDPLMGSDIARLFDSVWTYIVLFFGSIICIVFASGHAAGTAWPSESWMRYGWPVGFGLMAGAAFVAAFTYNWVRLLEVTLMSLLFAGAYREAHVWTHMHPTLLWLTLAGAAAVFMAYSIWDPYWSKTGPNIRLVWPVIVAVILGIAACVYFRGWTLIWATIMGAGLLILILGFMPTKRQYELATR